ncbi:hypothetical protein NMG60_11027969 [Bertholletia excelsa]
MAVSAACCLNPPPRPPASTSSSSSLPTKTTQFAAWRKKEGSWRSQCVMGVACILLGLENFKVNQGLAEAAENMQAVVELEPKKGEKRWSDMRACPPWRLNSLETIVPENLPRPSLRRRWEWVDDGHNTRTAPPVKETSRRSGNNGGCFTM